MTVVEINPMEGPRQLPPIGNFPVVSTEVSRVLQRMNAVVETEPHE